MRELEGDQRTEQEIEEENRERNRIEVINEILISERYYVRDLEIIIRVLIPHINF